jgi:hypothetical protein
MGAEFCFQVFQADDRQHALQRAREIIDQAAHDYGHAGYSGSFAECPGARIENKAFPTFGDAEEWLVEHAQKWEAAVLVQVETVEGVQRWAMGAWCSS